MPLNHGTEVNCQQLPTIHYDFAIDHREIHTLRGAEYQRRQGIVQRTGVVQPAKIEPDEVSRHAWSKLAHIVTIEHISPAPCRHPQGFFRRQACRVTGDTLQKQRYPGLGQQVG